MIDEIVKKIKETILEKHICLIALDGNGGSGKSTLAREILSSYGSGQIIHMDDFYKPSKERLDLELNKKESGSNYDISRLIRDVINPIAQGTEARYQRYDWVEDKLAEWHVVQPNGLLIIEGVYSLCDQLHQKYDIKIFVECNRELRLKRGLERDGDDALDFWKQWMSEEDKYLQEQKPQERADFIISGEK